MLICFSIAIAVGAAYSLSAWAGQPPGSGPVNPSLQVDPGIPEGMGMTPSPDGDGWMVPDCNGGRIKAPRGIAYIPFWGAFCVQAPANRDLVIDMGTSLIAYDGLNDAKAATDYQVYYSLNQVTVPRGRKQVVFAVCGGAGDWLWSGSRVVPGHRLPAASSKRLADHMSVLMKLSAEMDFLRRMTATASPADAVELKRRVDELNAMLTDAAGLLRDALIHENRALLTNSGP